MKKAHHATTNTTRVLGSDFSSTQAEASRMVFFDARPTTVYLAPSHSFIEAVAAAPLQHFPAGGPLLLTPRTHLDPIVRNVLLELKPTGHTASGTSTDQVVLVGNLSAHVAEQVRALGFTVGRVTAANPLALTVKILQLRGRPRDIILISDNPRHGGQVAASHAAHMGNPILFYRSGSLPQATRTALRMVDRPRVYVVALNGTVPSGIEAALRRLGASFVGRIGGSTLADLAVNFSRYKSPVSSFGWGKKSPGGHAFSFVVSSPWQFLVSSLPFSHRGKHTPFLYTRKRSVPRATHRYIRSVNPMTMDRPPFMHGFIIGDQTVINGDVQKHLQHALSIDAH